MPKLVQCYFYFFRKPTRNFRNFVSPDELTNHFRFVSFCFYNVSRCVWVCVCVCVSICAAFLRCLLTILKWRGNVTQEIHHNFQMTQNLLQSSLPNRKFPTQQQQAASSGRGSGSANGNEATKFMQHN